MKPPLPSLNMFPLIPLLSLGLTHLTHAQTFNCASFWPTLTPGEYHTINAPCSYYPGYPTTIGATSISVIHPTSLTPLLITPSLTSLLSSALAATISLYSTLTLPHSIPAIILVLTNLTETNVLITNSPEYPPSPCQIIAYAPFLAGVDVNPGVASQQLAHEIYHCIQQVHIDPLTPSNKWIREGSAMYFSNVVYPTVDAEGPDIARYNPSVPVYAHTGAGHASAGGGEMASAYAAGLFFQGMEGRWGMVGVNDFVMGTRGTGSMNEERARLSGVGAMAGDWYGFVGDYALGRAFPMALVGVRDTGGGFVKPAGGTGGGPVVVGMIPMDAEGKEARVDLRGVPFTVSEFVVEVDGGQIVMISVGPGRLKGGQRVGWRLEGQMYWSEVPDGAGGGSKGFVVTPCEESVKVYLLFSSTEDVDVDKVTVTVKQFYKDETCPCKSGKKRKGGIKDGCKEKKPPPPVEEGSGSCAGSDLPTDKCIMGVSKWALDLPSTKRLVEQKMRETLPGDTGIGGIVVNVHGSGEFIVGGDEGRNVTMTYKGLSIESIVEVEGMSIPTTTTIDGVVEAKMFTTSTGGEGNGSVCLVMYAGHGSVVGSSPLVGEVLRYDIGAGNWISQDWDVRYTCGGGRFTIHGTLNGATTFGPFVYNAVG